MVAMTERSQRIIISVVVLAFVFSPGQWTRGITAAPKPVDLDHKRTASDAARADRFGESVSIYSDAAGDTALIGAIGKNQARGAAYIWEQHLGGVNRWGQRTKLIAADLSGTDYFGWSVSLHRDTAIVGAGLQKGRQGSVYVFERHLGGPHRWGKRAKIRLPKPKPNDFFGRAVSLSGDTLVIGAPGENPYANDEGAVYVYERNLGGKNQWGQRKRIITQQAGKFGKLGAAVCVDSDTAILGCSHGRAFLYERNLGGAESWGARKMLVPADRAEKNQFGVTVGISGDIAVVGAPSNDKHTGAVYVFRRNSGGPENWGQVAKLAGEDGELGDQFGQSVAIRGSLVIVGAPGKDKRAITDSGAAYVYQQVGDAWREVSRLLPKAARDKEFFGRSVAVSQGVAVVGSLDDQRGEDAGAAYFFLMLEQLEVLEGLTWHPARRNRPSRVGLP